MHSPALYFRCLLPATTVTTEQLNAQMRTTRPSRGWTSLFSVPALNCTQGGWLSAKATAQPAQRLAKPLLDEMAAVPGTLKVGVHIRIGDSGLSNALKRHDARYPLGCAPSHGSPAAVRLLCVKRP